MKRYTEYNKVRRGINWHGILLEPLEGFSFFAGCNTHHRVLIDNHRRRHRESCVNHSSHETNLTTFSHLLRCNAPQSYSRWCLYYLIQTVHQRTAGIFECPGHDSPEERKCWDVGICKFPGITHPESVNNVRVLCWKIILFNESFSRTTRPPSPDILSLSTLSWYEKFCRSTRLE